MKEPINPLYPLTEVRSLDELMDIAVSMEIEAGERFDALAGEMERLGNFDTAELFRTLAGEERDHEAELSDWAAREHGREPARVPFRWRMPETFDTDEAEHSVYTMTPHEALSIAVRNEERAFAFYTYLAAIATTDAIRTRAEGLAKGELDHVARLRLRRRQAFRAEFGHAGPRPDVATVEDLLALAIGLETGRAELDERLAAVLEGGGDVASARMLREIAAETRTQAATLGKKVPAPAGEPSRTHQAASAAGILEPRFLTATGALCLSLRNAEEIFQAYADIAERTQDEALLWEAQAFAERAMARLALISARAQELD